MPDEKIIDYVLRFGGRCRDCADNNGICENSGLPCEVPVAEKAVEHVLSAIRYGVKHGFIENPITPGIGEAST